MEKGLEVILETQVEVDGRLTVWCAQYDRFELSCARARTYEPPSLSGAESVAIVRYLMEIEPPGSDVVRAVQSAVAWFEHAKLTGIAVVDRPDPSLPGGFDRVVIPDETAPAHWARFYEIGTNRPIFVGRDGIIRTALAEIEHERRTGYRWLGTWAQELLEEEYPAWQVKWRPTSWSAKVSASSKVLRVEVPRTSRIAEFETSAAVGSSGGQAMVRGRRIATDSDQIGG